MSRWDCRGCGGPLVTAENGTGMYCPDLTCPTGNRQARRLARAGRWADERVDPDEWFYGDD